MTNIKIQEHSMYFTKVSLKKIIKLFFSIFLISFLSFYFINEGQLINFYTLSDYRDTVMQWIEGRRLVVILLFIIIYAAAVSISFPGAVWFTIAGGFFFGIIEGTIYAVFGATLGAILAFLSARYLFYDFFQTKGGIVAQKIKIGFEKNSLSYLFFLRLFPFFPFWLVNVVPALIGVQLKSYVVTTFLGIIPGTAIYASLGNGLGVAFDADAIPGLNKIFEPQILWPIVALSLVSLVPILLKSSRQRDQR